MTVVHETRSGSYTEINEAFPSNERYTGEYRKFLIDHGKNPVAEHYAYVTLPGIDEAGLTAYAKEKPLGNFSKHIRNPSSKTRPK